MVAGFISTDNGNMVSIQEVFNGINLADATIKDDEVRERPLLMFEPTLEYFTKVRCVVIGLATKLELPIFRNDLKHRW